MNDTPTIGQAKCMVGYVEKLERELNESNERIKFLTEAYAKAHEEICQTAGKALGYPWLKDDQKNFPGATEKDGVCVGEHVAETVVEELANKYTEANARIKRMEVAGDAIAEYDLIPDRLSEAWFEAKEAKP